MKEFLKNLFSADEKRVSTLIMAFFLFIGCFIVVLKATLNGQVVDENILTMLKEILISLVYIIGGVNVIPEAISKFVKKDETKIENGGI